MPFGVRELVVVTSDNAVLRALSNRSAPYEGVPLSEICLILQPMHAAGAERLREAGFEARLADSLEPDMLFREVADVAAILTRDARVDVALMDAAPNLRVIGVHGVGIDNIEVAAATARAIAVVNTPGANARSVAEHALALTFHLAKAIGAGDRAARARDGDYKFRTLSTELAGATFGVVGFGAIGRETARLAAALGMKVVVWTRRPDDPVVLAEGFCHVAELDDLLARSDVVSLHLPSAPDTRKLIGAAQLAAMKPTALLVNTARGALIDEHALAAALSERRIGGAGLDVVAQEPLPADSPLIGLDNVVLTPHVGGSTQAALRRTATALADQVAMALAGERPTHLVNADAWMAITAERRAEGAK
jgi:D-3-phosphoglycerate dehydrogenase